MTIGDLHVTRVRYHVIHQNATFCNDLTRPTNVLKSKKSCRSNALQACHDGPKNNVPNAWRIQHHHHHHQIKSPRSRERSLLRVTPEIVAIGATERCGRQISTQSTVARRREVTLDLHLLLLDRRCLDLQGLFAVLISTSSTVL